MITCRLREYEADEIIIIIMKHHYNLSLWRPDIIHVLPIRIFASSWLFFYLFNRTLWRTFVTGKSIVIKFFYTAKGLWNNANNTIMRYHRKCKSMNVDVPWIHHFVKTRVAYNFSGGYPFTCSLRASPLCAFLLRVYRALQVNVYS